MKNFSLEAEPQPTFEVRYNIGSVSQVNTASTPKNVNISETFGDDNDPCTTNPD